MKGFIALLFYLVIFLLIIKTCLEKETTKYETIKTDIQTKHDSLPYLDSLVLIKLINPLKKREGFSQKLYCLDSIWYIGYGHMINNNYNQTHMITKHQADSILWVDIKKAYFEVQRIERKKLYKNTFKIFISGHL